MLNLIEKSRGSKTLGIGDTYHYESGAAFGTCPPSCSLMPAGMTAAAKFDFDYAAAVSVAVPRDGFSFTYSHYDPSLFIDLYCTGRTVINSSALNIAEAAASHKNGIPTVVDVPPYEKKRFHFAGVEFRACPATLESHINCGNCGGSRGPICAQAGRSWVVTFPWHGPPAVLAKAIESGRPKCYGADGRVGMQWQKLARTPPPEVRASNRRCESGLVPWVAKLPRGSRLRQHVVGDLGRAA